MVERAYAAPSLRFLFVTNPIKVILAKNRETNKRLIHAVVSRPSGARQQIEEYGQAARAISTASLNPSLDLHSQPIKQVVFLRPLEVLRPREALS